MISCRIPYIAAVCLALAVPASASPITEIEANNFLATSQFIPGSAFTLPVPATAFSLYPTATVSALGGGTDVDFYSFTSAGGNVYFDVDGGSQPVQGTGFDTQLFLFDSSGAVLALDDDSNPVDLGSVSALDAFLGVYALPGPGTYYLAVNTCCTLPYSSLASATGFSVLVRPDGVFVPGMGPGSPGFGGLSYAGTASVGEPSFSTSGGTDLGPRIAGSSPYTLHLSVQNPTVGPAVAPEPASMVLLGSGLITLAARRWRQRRSR